MIRQQRPLCERCLVAHRTTPTSEVHHIVSVEEAPKRRLDVSNLLAVCHECHEDIHGVRMPHNGKHQVRLGATTATNMGTDAQ